MSKLIDINGVIEDVWVRTTDGQKAEDHSNVIVNLAQLRNEYESLLAVGVEIGVELEPDALLEDILFCLPELKLVVLRFESFADGRAFSQAKLLRDRYGYEADIRAVGDVIRDQLGFMQRCGFNQFEIAEEEDLEVALQAFSQITYGYQSDLVSSVIRH